MSQCTNGSIRCWVCPGGYSDTSELLSSNTTLFQHQEGTTGAEGVPEGEGVDLGGMCVSRTQRQENRSQTRDPQMLHVTSWFMMKPTRTEEQEGGMEGYGSVVS